MNGTVTSRAAAVAVAAGIGAALISSPWSATAAPADSDRSTASVNSPESAESKSVDNDSSASGNSSSTESSSSSDLSPSSNSSPGGADSAAEDTDGVQDTDSVDEASDNAAEVSPSAPADSDPESAGEVEAPVEGEAPSEVDTPEMAEKDSDYASDEPSAASPTSTAQHSTDSPSSGNAETVSETTQAATTQQSAEEGSTAVAPSEASPAPAAETVESVSESVGVATSEPAEAALPATVTVSPFVKAVRAWVFSLLHSPDSTPESPVLLTVLAWARRQLQGAFVNEAPTAQPITYLQADDGQVLGTLGATDAEDEPLRYALVQGPANGTVQLTSSGDWVYTPTADFATTGGVDDFIVSVRDSGFHPVRLLSGTSRILVPVVVTLEPVDDQPEVPQSTRGFEVWNLSSSPMMFTGYGVGHNAASGPAVGELRQPGEKFRFEVTWNFLSDTRADPEFTNANGSMSAFLLVKGASGSSNVVCTTVCTPNSNTWVSGNSVVFLDRPGTVINVSGDDAQKQSDVLNWMCFDGSKATCTFRATSQELAFTPSHQVGQTYNNPFPYQQSMSITESTTVGATDSVAIAGKVQVKVGALVNVELQTTYQHTWQTSHTFSYTSVVYVPPWTIASFWVADPIYRNYGDFTLTMGNTTYHLTDVYFDSPNPSGNTSVTPQYVPIDH